MVEWEDGSTSYVPLSMLAADDPVACAVYARDHDLLDTPGWTRFKSIARRHKKYIRMVNQAKLRSYRTTPKYMFEIPRDFKHAVELDKRNGNTKWQDCTKLEMQQLFLYDTVCLLSQIPEVTGSLVALMSQEDVSLRSSAVLVLRNLSYITAMQTALINTGETLGRAYVGLSLLMFIVQSIDQWQYNCWLMAGRLNQQNDGR